MIIPNKIKIGAYDYDVLYTDDHARIDAFFGRIDCETQKIFLSSEFHLKRQVIEQAFIHELLHAIWFDKGLNLTEMKDKEEIIVSNLAMGLYQTLNDNKLIN